MRTSGELGAISRIRSGLIEKVTAEMKNLKEEIVSTKDDIKQIKCNSDEVTSFSVHAVF